MPSWNELIEEFNRQPAEFLRYKVQESLNKISRLRNNRNVIFYASAFLQKPEVYPHYLQITHEDLNGFMSVMYGMEWEKGLTLILHTPGGFTNAVETIVEYLLQKFDYIETIIPTLAMSAGTMICLASNKIIMGRQSQLGPIDSQMFIKGYSVSAQSIVDQFNQAKEEILKNQDTATVWFPILQSIGPALLKEAQKALAYGETIVKRWLSSRMFSEFNNSKELAEKTAKFFKDASQHLNHGRRIDREEARKQNLIVEDLEENQELQEWVLTSYHLMTIAFEKSPATKFIESNHDRRWIKNWHTRK